MYLFRFPLFKKSISGFLAVNILIGYEDLLCGKLYNVDYPEATACGFPQNVWDYFLLPYVPYLPDDDGNIADPNWTRPTYDAFANTIMTEYIHPIKDVNGEYYGQLILDIDIFEIFSDVIKEFSTNDSFMIIVSTYNYQVVAATEEINELLFNNKTSSTELFHWDNSFLNQSKYISDLEEYLQDERINEADATIDGKDYLLSWQIEEAYKYAIVAAVPYEILDGASWYVIPPLFEIKYSSNDEVVEEKIEIKNNGTFVFQFQITYPDYFEIIDNNDDNYHLEDGESVVIHFRIKLPDSKQFSPDISIIPNGDNSECYSSLRLPTSYRLINCMPNDYDIFISDCDRFSRKVTYKWRNDTICRGGISLPDSHEITCRILNIFRMAILFCTFLDCFCYYSSISIIISNIC